MNININKKLALQIAAICFVAEMVKENFFNGLVLLIYKCIGYTPAKITCYGILGCLTEAWMLQTLLFTMVLFNLCLIILGYALSKKAFQTKNTNYYLAGATLFYPFVSSLFEELFYIISGHFNPIHFFSIKEELQAEPMPLFDNYYNFFFFRFMLARTLQTLYIFLAYKLVAKFWTKEIRLYFFTIGVVACGSGCVFWYFFLGPILYR